MSGPCWGAEEFPILESEGISRYPAYFTGHDALEERGLIRNSGEKNPQAGRIHLAAGTDRKKSKTE